MQLKFIRQASYGCAKYLTAQLKENNEKRRVYYFGFQVLIGSITKIVILTAISLLLGTLLPTVIMVLMFGTLRVFAGGYHMDSYGKCLASSISMFVAAGLIVKYTSNYCNFTLSIFFLIMCFLVAIFAEFRWAPGDTPNKPITKPDEIKKFKRVSLIYTVIWFGISVILLYYKFNGIVLAGCFGVLFEIFSITPFGYTFFDLIRDGMNRGRYRHA